MNFIEKIKLKIMAKRGRKKKEELLQEEVKMDSVQDSTVEEKKSEDLRVEELFSEDAVFWSDVQEDRHKVVKRRTVNNKTGEASDWSDPELL